MRTSLRAVGAALATIALVAVTPAAYATTNDPYYSRLWGLKMINAEQAWPTTTGEGVTVAVLDTGIDFGQPDLQGRVLQGATFAGCPQSGTSCGNGDWKGIDGVGESADVHGTHVAGIIAANRDNGIGIVGVAPDAEILPVKVMENGQGSNVDIAAGIRWAADHGANVINMSLGGLPGTQVFGLVDTSVVDAVAYARSKGVLTVAAAGNSSGPVCNDPAFNSDSICIGSVGPLGLKSYFSDLPLKTDFNAMAAPGGQGTGGDNDIWSTVPQGTGDGGGDYASFAGTSMATPQVAGAAALLFAQGRSVDNVQKALLDTAINPLLGVRGGWSVQYGRGVLDAKAAVDSPGAVG